MPFSDPFADGKTLQTASSRALAAGMTPEKAIAMIARLRKNGMETPVFAMTYYNIIYCAGLDAFLGKLKKAGADGVIVPDVPLGESGELGAACKKAGLAMVMLITPNCTDGRIADISKAAGGFLYAVAAFGTTGARKSVDERAIALVKRTKKLSDLPVIAGF